MKSKQGNVRFSNVSRRRVQRGTVKVIAFLCHSDRTNRSYEFHARNALKSKTQVAAKENETIEKRRMSLHPTSGQIQDQVNMSQL